MTASATGVAGRPFGLTALRSALVRFVRRRLVHRRQALAGARRRRKRFLAALAALPGRLEEAHAEHLLRRAQEIDAAGDRPPAVAGLLEEREPAQPLLLRERWHVAVEAAADDIEAEQRQPVLQAIERDEVAVPGRRRAAAEIPTHAEQRERIEARDDDLALGADHAPRLAQHQVRIAREFERVRHDDQVERILGERQRMRICDDVGRRVVIERPARCDAALREESMLGQADLQRAETEDVGHGQIEIRLLALPQVHARRRREPRGERWRQKIRGTRRLIHDDDYPDPRIQGQLHLGRARGRRRGGRRSGRCGTGPCMAFADGRAALRGDRDASPHGSRRRYRRAVQAR